MTPFLLHHLLPSGSAELERPAIVDRGRTYRYAELVDAVERIAARLRAAAIERGDRIAILLPKSFDECAAIFGAARAGAVFVPINPALKPAQVRHIVADCGARALVTSPPLHEALGSALADLKQLSIVFASDAIGDAGGAGGAASERRFAEPIGEDLAAILYTSGSTGAPKGVMLSHRNLLAGTRIVRTYLDIGPQDRILSLLPFSFDYGLNQLLTTVEQRATIALLTFRLGDEIVRALAEQRITGLAGVPTIWAILTGASPSFGRTPLPHLRYLTNSGGAVPTATVRKLREKLPDTRIYLMYGLTEAFRSTYLPPEEIDRRPGSIGKAIPECEVFPLTADGRRAKPGEPGILVHRGPTVSLGYWNRPEDTARVLRPNPFCSPLHGGDVVCYSGDRVVEDEDGYLYFVARDDAMIKSAGHRISPTEVEEVLMGCGGFRQVAVIGLPDEWVGQRVHAVAIAAAEPPDLAEVLRQAAAKLPAYMLPSRIELV
ncbi:MAG TPA: AMP-binding protein, partial [Burkholderiaceae bacterium]|nr:AMP-binding protein [Burkholderiaceae bacterium]